MMKFWIVIIESLFIHIDATICFMSLGQSSGIESLCTSGENLFLQRHFLGIIYYKMLPLIFENVLPE